MEQWNTPQCNIFSPCQWMPCEMFSKSSLIVEQQFKKKSENQRSQIISNSKIKMNKVNQIKRQSSISSSHITKQFSKKPISFRKITSQHQLQKIKINNLQNKKSLLKKENRDEQIFKLLYKLQPQKHKLQQSEFSFQGNKLSNQIKKQNNLFIKPNQRIQIDKILKPQPIIASSPQNVNQRFCSQIQFFRKPHQKNLKTKLLVDKSIFFKEQQPKQFKISTNGQLDNSSQIVFSNRSSKRINYSPAFNSPDNKIFSPRANYKPTIQFKYINQKTSSTFIQKKCQKKSQKKYLNLHYNNVLNSPRIHEIHKINKNQIKNQQKEKINQCKKQIPSNSFIIQSEKKTNFQKIQSLLKSNEEIGFYFSKDLIEDDKKYSIKKKQNEFYLPIFKESYQSLIDCLLITKNNRQSFRKLSFQLDEFQKKQNKKSKDIKQSDIQNSSQDKNQQANKSLFFKRN